MSERESMPRDLDGFEINPAIEAAIEAKIAEAHKRGVDLEALTEDPNADRHGIFAQIGCTVDESEYMAKRELYRVVQEHLGFRMVQTLWANNCRVARKDMVACLQAFFDANGYDDEQPKAAA